MILSSAAHWKGLCSGVCTTHLTGTRVKVCTFDGVAHKRNQVMLPGQRQPQAAPDDAQRHAQLAAQPGKPLEVEQLAVSQMVHRQYVCSMALIDQSQLRVSGCSGACWSEHKRHERPATTACMHCLGRCPEVHMH